MSTDRLHPVIVHHLVNTLGWRSLRPMQQEAVAPLPRWARCAVSGSDRGRQNRGGMFPAVDSDGTAGLAGTVGGVHVPVEGAVDNLLLSTDERRRAEQAFAEARDCVIVSTSTLEPGIDVGDLDRVIQVNAPGSVASFLQRLGCSRRRAGSTRNCLFLALDEWELLWAAGLLHLWDNFTCGATGTSGQSHRHRNHGTLSRRSCSRCACSRARSGGLCGTKSGTGSRRSIAVANRLCDTWWTRDFSTATVLLLGGRSWKVTWIYWKRRRCIVEAAERRARSLAHPQCRCR